MANEHSDVSSTSSRTTIRPRRSRDDAKRETREALIAAGVSAFAEEGLDAPSLDSICARAGYTRGAFYVHFKDRDDFLIAVVTSLLEGFMDAIIATGDAALDLQKTIDTFVGAVVAGTFPVKGGVQYHQLLAACARSSHIRERYVEVLRQAAARLAKAIREGQGAGTVRGDIDPEQVGMILVGIVSGLQTFIEVGYSLDVVRAAADLSRLLKPAEG
jgi:AcrR family transcriptional regulator